MVTQGVCISYTAHNTRPHGSHSYRFAEISRWLGKIALKGRGVFRGAQRGRMHVLPNLIYCLGVAFMNSADA